MKKSILAVAGVAAFAGVAMPFGGAFATPTTSQVDTIDVTIADSCQLAYQSGTGKSAHTNGGTTETPTGTWGSGDTANTLSFTIANNAANTNFGSTNFNVVCNDNQGYDVKLTATALTGQNTSGKITSVESIPYITSTSGTPIKAGTSAWGVSNDSGLVLSGGTVATASAATASTDFSVTYGVSTSSTLQADTYEGTATYNLTHPHTD